MQTHNLIQGTKEWLAHRSCFWNASDAPAMMGQSPYKSRSALLKEIATGLGDEVSAEQQRLFDSGHRAEALARPLAEKIIGEELYPIVGSSGDLSASFDGLTLMYDVAFEHKLLNDSLRDAIRQQGGNANDFLPPHYRIQMEQQCHVSGAERVLFMATKWDGDKLVEERHCWYTPDLELRAQILAGWKQFEADVAAYQAPAAAAPEAIAEPVEHLPAVVVAVSGEIEVTANFKPFEAKLRDFLDNKLIRQPKTDQDFVDLDAQIKAMKAGRDALKGAKGQMLGGVQPVDQAVKTIDMLDDLLQKACSAAERTLKEEKERRKTEIVVEAQTKLREHCAALSARVGVIVSGIADFAGVIKGLKSLDSMEGKLSAELARAKIEASQAADLIDANRKAMEAADAAGLFPDFASVCTKPADDFANLITSRRAAAEQRLQAERERIRAEEAARLEREQRAAEQARAEAAARLEREQRQEAERQARELQEARERSERAEAAQITQDAQESGFVAGTSALCVSNEAEPAQASPSESGAAVQADQGTARSVAPAPEVRAFTRTAPAAAHEQYTVRLGEIQALMAPYTVTAEGLAQQGFPAHVERGLKLYRRSDVRAIFLKASKHFAAKAEELLQAA